jgi:hypothetical protein
MFDSNESITDTFDYTTNEIFNEITSNFSNLINNYLTNNNDSDTNLIYSIEFEPIYSGIFDISLDRTID